MKIFKDLSTEIPDTNSHHWNFEPFQQEDGIILAVGYNSLNHSGLDAYRNDNKTKVVLFNNWAPCEYAQRDIKKGVNAILLEDKFDHILTICKYTARWRNLNSKKSRYIYAFYPYSAEIVPPKTEKKYDAIYHGGIHGKEHVMAMRAIMDTNYRYLSLDYGINPLTRRYLRYATDTNLPFKKKIERIAECKVSVCFNLIHVSYKHYRNMMVYRSALSKGGDFFDDLSPYNLIRNYPWVGVLPQFKTRVHEAAISRCVNLIYRDPWNVIEDYYEPDKEFIYFDSETDLREKMSYVLQNWDSDYVQSVVNSAYQKAARYTSENFLRIYSGVLSGDSPTCVPDFSQDQFWA
jgi:hypothetical protein